MTISLSALERTYLGYVRTSLALSIIGIVIAQLFRLQHTENPSLDVGFFVIGIPLAATCIVAAMLVMLLGCYRFWRQQNAMLRGKIHAGGWELDTVAFITLLVCFSITPKSSTPLILTRVLGDVCHLFAHPCRGYNEEVRVSES